MSRSCLSLDDVINPDVLRRAQAPLREIAKQLHVQEVDGQYDFRPVLLAQGQTIATASATLRLGKDDLVMVVSALISENHFNPYRMAIFATDEIQVAGLRAELWAWINYASKNLHSPVGHIFKNGRLLVDWYRSLVNSDSVQTARLITGAHLAGLVARYYFPQALPELRTGILHELQDMAGRGVELANQVFELLTSPSVKIKKENELHKEKDYVEGTTGGLEVELVEEVYEFEIESNIQPETGKAKSQRTISRLIQEDKLSRKPVKIVIAGHLDEINTIYALYLLFRYQVANLGIHKVQVDIGISDTLFYIATTERYVKALRQWFQNAQQRIRGLAHLIRFAASNDFNAFQNNRNVSTFVPTEEELVLFYLKMLSPKWNSTFINIIDRKGSHNLRDYRHLKDRMMKLIPKDWGQAIAAYTRFCEFINRSHPKFSGIINALQPINLMTDNQITHATVIFTVSRDSKKTLIRRFPGGAINKALFFNDIDPKVFTLGRSILESPYTPQKFIVGARWDLIKEHSITSVLAKYVIPILERDVSINKIRSIKLVELRRESKEAIEAVKQYILQLQKLSLNGNDQALIDGLIFFLAVKSDIAPHTDEWDGLLTRYREHREDLQAAVFECDARSLPNFAAIKFLKHYLGPRNYVDKHFPDTFQKYNDKVFNLLIGSIGTRTNTKHHLGKARPGARRGDRARD
jgi:hypothetical protein